MAQNLCDVIYERSENFITEGELGFEVKINTQEPILFYTHEQHLGPILS
jgi:hypothetical protein